MIKYFLFLSALLLSLPLHSQIRKGKPGGLKILNPAIDSSINETSGLVYCNNRFYTINDSGDGPFIYEVNDDGSTLIRKIRVRNALNVDWEEITQDNNFIYVGDIGNNFGRRKNLCIYKINKEQLINSTDTLVDSEKIEFSYEGVKVSEDWELSKYDSEAFICFNDTIVIFNKNWQEYWCYIYTLPNIPGKYTITQKNKFRLNGLVTASTLSPDKKTLLLLGYREYIPFVLSVKLQHVSDLLKPVKFKTRQYPCKIYNQTEGIMYVNDSVICVSSEYNPIRKGKLFRASIK